MHRPRPYTVTTLNYLRTQLLRDPFFDQNHKPEELGVRTRPGRVLFMDLVVMLARLLRVLMRRGSLAGEDMVERITIRNECLDQQFFDRAVVNNPRPFVGDEDFEDEGYSD